MIITHGSIRPKHEIAFHFACKGKINRTDTTKCHTFIHLELWKKHKDLPQSQWNVLFNRIEIRAVQGHYAMEAKPAEASRKEDAP